MKRKAATQNEKDWHNAAAQMGEVYFGEPCLIHHCIGGSGKHNKRHIGQEFIIPLPPKLHDNTDISLHKSPKAFAHLFELESRKEVEKMLYSKFATQYGRPQDLIDCVMSYSR